MKKPRPEREQPRRHHLDSRAGQLAADLIGDDDELLSTPQTAMLLGVSVPFLEIGRSAGYGPPYCRVTPRLVRYRRGDLRQWLRQRTFTSTAQYRESDAPVVERLDARRAARRQREQRADR
jgi:hypothetical protein